MKNTTLTGNILRKIKNIVKKIRKLEASLNNISDEELSGLTRIFMDRYKSGESLESLLPESFAAMCEADWRVLGKRPYDVQIMAGIALHYGYLAEMNTGEGKTLMATLPLYLNALTGRNCMLITTNEYLASRDGEEMGQVYEFMGLTCAYPEAAGADEDESEKRKKLYSANITYHTNSGLGFDYLFNNLVKRQEDRFIKDMYFAIVDEADAVLLDAATMPLVISGAPRVKSNLYNLSDFFVTTLKEDDDYIEEDGAVWLTEDGAHYAEEFFGIDNFYDKNNFEINRHVTLALRAHKLMKNKKDYVVTDKKEVALFDGATGRLMEGVKLRGGQHQAIEAKEKVKISSEFKTVATVTYQNLFQLFEKFAGMSGTIIDAKDELFDVYHKKVVRIPTNRPNIRKDHADKFYPNSERQFFAARDRVVEIHKTGQPILVILNSVTDTDAFSHLMMQENIPHNVLNASNAFWEAEIIKAAGQMGAVTVATPMAGRGTDIKLGEGVHEKGGLAVIGVGRMNNIRTERQARGRAGRQGDPGFSEFYVSLDDDVANIDDKDEHMLKYIDEERHISKRRIKKIVGNAQKNAEEMEKYRRKHEVQYDTVLQIQRDFIYETRNNLLNGARIEESLLLEIAGENISDFLKSNKKITINEINRYILDNLSYSLDEGTKELDLDNKDDVKKYLLGRVEEGLEIQKKRIGNNDLYEQFVREVTLSAIDGGWIDLIDYLEQLKYAVAGRSSAQRNVLFEYQNESYESFMDAKKAAKQNIMRNVLQSEPIIDKKTQKMRIVYP